MRTRWKRAFTLLEMLSLCVIVVLLAAGFVFALRSTSPKLPPRMAAEMMAEILQAAQARAKSEQVVVAIVFPTGGGQTSSFQSYYKLEGMENPEFILARDLSSEMEQTYWSTAYDPTFASLTLSEAEPNSLGLTFENWNPPYPEDHHLLFLPSGEVTSNGLPLYDDQYRLVVAQGVDARPGSVTGTAPVSWAASLRQLNARTLCSTVIVGRDGQVSVVDQLPDSSLTLVEEAPTPNVEDMPSKPERADALLTLAEPLEISPDPVELIDMLPDNADALVAENRHLKLGVRVTSNRGFPLSCVWTSSILEPGPYTGSEVGEFSSPSEQAMIWNPSQRRWESDWSWAPPPGSAGAVFELSCEVQDSQGHALDTSNGALVVRSSVSNDPFRLGIVSGRVTDTNPTGEWRGYLCRGDGTDFQEVSGVTDQATWVAVSPNGQYLALETNLPGTPAPPAPGGRSRLIITRRDGSGRIDIARPNPDLAGSDYYPTWSPGGQYVIFLRRPGNDASEIQVLRASLSDRVDGVITPQVVLDDPATGSWFTEPHVSPGALSNGNHRIVATYVRGPGNGADIYTAEISPQGSVVGPGQLVTDWGTRGCFYPYFHPINPDLIVFQSNRTSGPPVSLYLTNLASLPLSPTGMGHVGLVSGAFHSRGIAKFDRAGNIYFPDPAGHLYRSSPADGYEPVRRITGGVNGFFVTLAGDVYVNRTFSATNTEVILQKFGQADGSYDRLTNNNVYDSTYGAAKLLLP